MSQPMFFKRGAGLSLAEIATLIGAKPRPGAPLDRRINDIAPLDRAGPSDLVFFDKKKFAADLAATSAAGCLTSEALQVHAPAQMAVLLTPEPYRAFVAVARALFPSSLRPSSLFETSGVSVAATVHPTARVESGVTIDPGAVVGPRAEIGAGTIVAAGAIIGPDVRIGRDCSIGAGSSLLHSLIGDRVIIHPGARLGQDGFGYLTGVRHQKVPQVARVIVQDDVEIGANTTIDRGALRDTIIGEGTKIDNLVHIAHNTVIGRHCLLVAQVGISGTGNVGDYAMLGGQVGVIDHVTIGEGAMVAGQTGIMTDVPAGARWGGSPGEPARDWMRGIAALRKLAKRDPEPAGKSKEKGQP